MEIVMQLHYYLNETQLIYMQAFEVSLSSRYCKLCLLKFYGPNLL